ncbi:MAG: RnfH family protein [Pseudomonadota bacterium]|jgi:putative ubiquitin-RnfH superfamily antitoxin RatB of RatAB toxin-antitoxin module|uniref:RnfH family protein n=1 Tax=Alteromonas sp. S167 TaxID=3117402 RepID=UPI002EBCEE06|nr:RnfH family protein [Pseudomonadota bacterium]MEC8416647.1 RnfH family protein [Pseudomonadota bacterium]
MSSKLINIEVAYALPTKQTIVDVALKEGTTVQQAIEASNILEQFPDIDLKATKVGVWSRVVKLNDTLIDGDRIEIYRPLIADPKEIRKRRAEKAKEEGRADKVTGGKPNPLKAKS